MTHAAVMIMNFVLLAGILFLSQGIMSSRFYPPSGELGCHIIIIIINISATCLLSILSLCSNTGNKPPESCVFSLVLSIGALIGKPQSELDHK